MTHDCCRAMCGRRLRIRKWMTAAAQLPEAVFAVAYGMANTPGSAALAYSGQTILAGRVWENSGIFMGWIEFCSVAVGVVWAGFVATGLFNYSGAWANKIEVRNHRCVLPGSSAVPCHRHETA
eukprot:COSAG04_NODE_1740_length_5739_cov_3.695035_3_plen_123_part_00